MVEVLPDNEVGQPRHLGIHGGDVVAEGNNVHGTAAGGPGSAAVNVGTTLSLRVFAAALSRTPTTG